MNLSSPQSSHPGILPGAPSQWPAIPEEKKIYKFFFSITFTMYFASYESYIMPHLSKYINIIVL